VRAKKAKIGQLWDLLNSKPGSSQKPNAQAPAATAAAGAPAATPAPAAGAVAPAATPPSTAVAPGVGPATKAPVNSNSSLAALCKPSKPSSKAAARNSDEVLYVTVVQTCFPHKPRCPGQNP
jgi:hypothetical protein